MHHAVLQLPLVDRASTYLSTLKTLGQTMSCWSTWRRCRGRCRCPTWIHLQGGKISCCWLCSLINRCTAEWVALPNSSWSNIIYRRGLQLDHYCQELSFVFARSTKNWLSWINKDINDEHEHLERHSSKIKEKNKYKNALFLSCC